MAPQVEKTWTQLCESKRPHPKLLRLVQQRGLSAQEVQVASSLRLVDIVPTPLLLELLKRLLPLNKLAEQLGLGGHYFSHVGR
jgi:hypothetical protein